MKKFNDPIEGFIREMGTTDFWLRGPGLWIAGIAGILLAKYLLV